eukprot:4539267-Pyramimonas_sp.AAC.1
MQPEVKDGRLVQVNSKSPLVDAGQERSDGSSKYERSLICFPPCTLHLHVLPSPYHGKPCRLSEPLCSTVPSGGSGRGLVRRCMGVLMRPWTVRGVTVALTVAAGAFEASDEAILPACFKSLERELRWRPSQVRRTYQPSSISCNFTYHFQQKHRS